MVKKLKTIKFSHNYPKLPEVWDGTQAVLMAISQVDIDHIKLSNPAFINYDTTYIDNNNKECKYPLDFKDGLILFFVHLNTGKPFTTIRRDYVSKSEYYHGAIGETFILERIQP
jgi:hypothetical protein